MQLMIDVIEQKIILRIPYSSMNHSCSSILFATGSLLFWGFRPAQLTDNLLCNYSETKTLKGSKRLLFCEAKLASKFLFQIKSIFSTP